MAEWAIFAAIGASGFFIYRVLKEIAEHLLQIRLLCADHFARAKLASDTAALAAANARSRPVVS